MQIFELKCGQMAEIIGFHPGNRHYRHSLAVMGLLPGVAFTLHRVAPLGDPIEIQIRGYMISLRKDEAAILNIRRIAS